MSKKKTFPTDQVPRTADEIKQEYFGLLGKSGEYQYQISVFQDELKALNGRMRELNMEMDARNKLDAQTPPPAASAAETTTQSTGGQ